MGSLILPQSVSIQLIDGADNRIALPDVLFTVRLSARQKNDLYLSPFVSDLGGRAFISRADFEYQLKAVFSSGVMDYVPVETCYPSVEIYVDQPEDIARALQAREKVWVALLDGEKERWHSMKNLLAVYRRARNSELGETVCIRDEWDGHKDEYIYNLRTN